MDVDQIVNIVSICCWVAFGAVIAVLVLSFVRGLFRGWKYGTYRLIAFAVLITITLVTLRPMANFLGGLNFENLGVQFSFTANNTAINVKLTTLYETGKNLITDLMKAYGAAGSEESLAKYALSDVAIVNDADLALRRWLAFRDFRPALRPLTLAHRLQTHHPSRAAQDQKAPLGLDARRRRDRHRRLRDDAFPVHRDRQFAQ
jgi:hypothetical protein